LLSGGGWESWRGGSDSELSDGPRGVKSERQKDTAREQSQSETVSIWAVGLIFSLQIMLYTVYFSDGFNHTCRRNI